MKRINHMQHGIASFSSSAFRLRRLLVVERASLARPTSSGWQHRAGASSDRLSSNPAARSDAPTGIAPFAIEGEKHAFRLWPAFAARGDARPP
jgi:hypothetical protein